MGHSRRPPPQPRSLALSGGDPEVFPGQMGYAIPPVNSGSTLSYTPSWLCPVNLQWKVPRRHPDQMSEPPQLSPFDAKELQFYSELQMSKLFTLYLYGWTAANLPGKLILASCIHILISSVTTQSLGGVLWYYFRTSNSTFWQHLFNINKPDPRKGGGDVERER